MYESYGAVFGEQGLVNQVDVGNFADLLLEISIVFNIHAVWSCHLGNVAGPFKHLGG